MRTTNVVRMAFLILAFVAHSSPSYADYYPDWQEDCDSHCNGNVRVHECEFADWSGAPWFDASSVCEAFECGFFVTCSPATEEARQRYTGLCEWLADGVGQGGTEWFNMQCDLNDGASEGTFYCSYNDPGCPE